MPNPSNRDDESPEEPPVGAEVDTGLKVSVGADPRDGGSTTVEAVTHPPRLWPSYDPEAAVALLLATVDGMEAEGAHCLAAGVSARMRLADPNFSAKNAGFLSFRKLTSAAESRGLLRVSWPAGASDYLLESVGDSRTAVENGIGSKQPTPTPLGASRTFLRRDLWRALNDWSNSQFVYDPQTHCLTLREIQPEASVQGGEMPEGQLLFPRVDTELQRKWISEFIETVAPLAQRESLRQVVDMAPDGEEWKLFRPAVYADKVSARRWDSFKRQHTLALIRNWASQNGLDFGSLLDSDAPQDSRAAAAPSEAHQDARSKAWDEASLREQIFAVIEKLPLSELLKIKVPLEYVVSR